MSTTGAIPLPALPALPAAAGHLPTGAKATAEIAGFRVETPLGRLTLSGDDHHVTHLFLPNAAVAVIRAPRAGGVPDGGPPAAVSTAQRQLEEYFAGHRRSFELPLAPSGTAFQRQVWFALADIPYGETISYAELAARVGRPRAFRAVGQANGANPIPIILPCHRVIASDGGIGGYGGGLDLKRQLLALEEAHRQRT